jgi:hypothetical protein
MSSPEASISNAFTPLAFALYLQLATNVSVFIFSRRLLRRRERGRSSTLPYCCLTLSILSVLPWPVFWARHLFTKPLYWGGRVTNAAEFMYFFDGALYLVAAVVCSRTRRIISAITTRLILGTRSVVLSNDIDLEPHVEDAQPE